MIEQIGEIVVGDPPAHVDIGWQVGLASLVGSFVDKNVAAAKTVNVTVGALKGVLAYSDEPLVSIDYNHCPASSTIDSLETAVLEGKLVRVVSWYDNEWGFSNRMVDTAGVIAKLL